MSRKWAFRPSPIREGSDLQLGTRFGTGFSPSCFETREVPQCHWLPEVARTPLKGFFTFVFSPSESRRILLPVVLHHIHLHLRQQKELLICSGILGSIFSIVKTSSLVVAPRPLQPASALPVLYCFSQRQANKDHFVHFSVTEAFISDRKVPK